MASPTVKVIVKGARGATGPMGPASGPLGAGSVTAETISNSGSEQTAIANKLGLANILAGTFGTVGARKAISSNIGGSIYTVAGPAYLGVTGSGDDGLTIDSGANFPAGVSLRRAGGTAESPTDLAAGLQSGYIDFRAKSGTYFWNHASIDAIVDTGIAFTPGNLPPSRLRFGTASDNSGAKVRMEISPTGGVEIGAVDGEEYYNPAPFGLQLKLWVASAIPDEWAAVINSRPSSGGGYGLRVHTVPETANSVALAVSSGAGTGSLKFAVTGQGRLGVGTISPICAGDFNGAVKVGSFTVGTAPSAAAGQGQIIFVSNEAGGATLAFSDSANWRRVTDNAIIS